MAQVPSRTELIARHRAVLADLNHPAVAQVDIRSSRGGHRVLATFIPSTAMDSRERVMTGLASYGMLHSAQADVVTLNSAGVERATWPLSHVIEALAVRAISPEALELG